MIAEPIVLETMGPMACISKWLCELYFCPIRCEIRAAIGIADTHELPINGLTLPPVVLYKILAINMPPMVPKTKANNPTKMIMRVLGVNKRSAVAEAPMETATNKVKIFKKWS